MENGMNYLWFQHQSNMQGSDGLYSRMTGNQMFRESIDPELDHKTRRVSDKFSENINTIANEPSLAFFRIQEHVRKTLPQLVEQKHEVQNIQTRVQGACFDTEYATNAVKTMYQSEFHFQNIQELLKNAMFMKQQIGYEESRRKQESSNPSMYNPSVSVQTSTGQTMTESTQSSDSSLAHSGHGQTSERSTSEASVGSSPRTSASPLASSPSSRPTGETPESSEPPSASLGQPSPVSNPGPGHMSASSPDPDASTSDADASEGPSAGGPGVADVPGHAIVINPGPSALSLNCDSDDIDVAAEVGEDDDIS